LIIKSQIAISQICPNDTKILVHNRNNKSMIKSAMKQVLLLSVIAIISPAASSQVPVSEEPLHKPVLKNKYIRLLDVWLQPGDTTQFHIHATPSLFVHLSSAETASQIKGEEWVKGRAVPGEAWFRSFTPDTLIHRVANVDTRVFHVNDIEIVSAFDTSKKTIKPLPFPVLFENEWATAYKLTNQNINGKIVRSRGPLIVELATGSRVMFNDTNTLHPREIKTGEYFYVEPGTSFYFNSATGNIKMIVFEIK
jgi:hypothetical protein